MHFETAYINEQGRRPGNQDSLVLMAAETRIGPTLLAGVFDGMGGLEKGELASGEMARALDAWFLRELPGIFEKCGKHLRDEAVFESWEKLVETQNRRLLSSAQRQGICLGTTAAVLLLTEKQRIVMHVGDSRVYEMDLLAKGARSDIRLLTCDHTLAQRAVELGELEPEEAGHDPRSHVLTRCIGAAEDVKPEFSSGAVLPGSVFLLCSDGFRNRISAKEIQEALSAKQGCFAEEGKMARAGFRKHMASARGCFAEEWKTDRAGMSSEKETPSDETADIRGTGLSAGGTGRRTSSGDGADDLSARLRRLQKVAFARGETDNMTAVAVRAFM